MSREFPKNPELKSSAQYQREADAAWAPKIARPTVGRIVHVFGLTDFGLHPSSPRAAIVAFVDPVDDLTINVGVWNTDGTTGPLQGLKHGSVLRDGGEPYWDWMDYQKGQAAKADELAERIEQMKAGHDKK